VLRIKPRSLMLALSYTPAWSNGLLKTFVGVFCCCFVLKQ
jgi:hypothetical protein